MDSDEVVIEDGNIRLRWEFVDEGRYGDFDATDPDDMPLLRYAVEMKGQSPGDEQSSSNDWYPVEDASYCTLVPKDTKDADLKLLGESMLRQIKAVIEPGTMRHKRTCEKLSWMGPEDISELKRKAAEASLE